MKKVKNVLFAACLLMIFIAQAHADDNKKQQGQQQHAPAPRSSGPSRSAPSHNTSHSYQSRPQQQAPARTHTQGPRQDFHQAPQQAYTAQPRQRAGQQGPRVYAVPQAAPVQNNTLFHRQHHNQWQPRYNFYDSQYHFYPYVNIASQVELSSLGYLIAFNGQNFYYDQGTFYLQEALGQYVAVPPPLGIIVNPIASNARQIEVNGQVYWRYKGVFYVQVSQGYQVVGPVVAVPADL